MKKAGIFFLAVSLFFSFLILLPNVQAIIVISETNEVYNLGDSLDVEIKTSFPEQLHGFLRVNLVCESPHLIYFSPIILKANKEKITSIEFPVSEALGSCSILAALEDNTKNELEYEESSELLLTDKININVSLNKEEFEPLETLEINGQAIKENGNEIDGQIDIFIEGQEYSTGVSEGDFSFSIELAGDIMPGTHEINLNVEDSEGNKGNGTIIFNVKQIPTYLEIETNDEKFFPEDILAVTPKLLDQAHQLINAEVNIEFVSEESVILFLSKDLILLDEKVDSGSETIYRFAKNMPPGNYILKANFNDLNTEKTVYILEFEKIDMHLENTTLTVTNVGNIHYKKSIEVVFKIEEQVTKEIIYLDLNIGETKIFDLSAPKGTYDIEINSDGNTTNFSNVPLTGGVTATVELGKEGPITSSWFFWLLLLLVISLIAFSYFIFRRTEGQIQT